MILIGSFFSGTVHRYKDQAIKTRFVVLGIPLFPIYGIYFINEKEGFRIPINRKSCWSGFCRVVFGFVGVIGMVLLQMDSDPDDIVLKFFFMSLFALSVIHWFRNWNIDEEELKKREVLEQGISYNMLPELLPVELSQKIAVDAILDYQREYGQDWESSVDNPELSHRQLCQIYAISAHLHRVQELKKHREIAERIYAEIRTLNP